MLYNIDNEQAHTAPEILDNCQIELWHQWKRNDVFFFFVFVYFVFLLFIKYIYVHTCTHMKFDDIYRDVFFFFFSIEKQKVFVKT